MADHNGSTDVSTTPLLGVLDTNHHICNICMNNNSLKAFLHDVEWVGDGGVSGNILDGLPGEEDEAPVAHPAAVGVRHRLKGGEHTRLKHRVHITIMHRHNLRYQGSVTVGTDPYSRSVTVGTDPYTFLIRTALWGIWIGGTVPPNCESKACSNFQWPSIWQKHQDVSLIVYYLPTVGVHEIKLDFFLNLKKKRVRSGSGSWQ